MNIKAPYLNLQRVMNINPLLSLAFIHYVMQIAYKNLILEKDTDRKYADFHYNIQNYKHTDKNHAEDKNYYRYNCNLILVT